MKGVVSGDLHQHRPNRRGSGLEMNRSQVSPTVANLPELKSVFYAVRTTLYMFPANAVIGSVQYGDRWIVGSYA